MTRETKLGLVVAGSFLALVGGVVVARLKQVDLPGEGGETAEKPAAAASESPAPKPEPEKHANPVSSEAVARANDKKMPAGPTDSPPVINPRAPATTTPPAQPTNPTPPEPKPMEPVGAAPAANAVGAPASPISSPPTDPMPPPKPADPPKEDKPAPGAVSMPPPVDPPPSAPAIDPKPEPPAPPLNPNSTPSMPAADSSPKPADVTPPAPPAPAPANPMPPIAPIPEPPAPPVPTVKQEPMPDVKSEPTPAANPGPVPTVIKQPAVETPSTPAPPPPLNPNVANTATPTVTVVPVSGGNPSGASLEAPRVPVGAPAKDSFTAPAARPTAPPEPKRDSYLEEQHRWRPGDSFAAISTQYYKSPNYADALLRYNQDYPLASREMRQNPPALSPGQLVWVPPPRILERDYANLIGGLTPIATPTSRPSVEPVNSPPGLANSGFAAPVEKLYRVRQPSESVQEIARRTLKNSAVAGRIQMLNPSLSADPRLPIPAGTILRLPGDAQVDAADKP